MESNGDIDNNIHTHDTKFNNGDDDTMMLIVMMMIHDDSSDR